MVYRIVEKNALGMAGVETLHDAPDQKRGIEFSVFENDGSLIWKRAIGVQLATMCKRAGLMHI